MIGHAASMDHVLGLMRKACNDVDNGHSHYRTFIEACASVAVDLANVQYAGQPEVWAAIQAERARQDAKFGWAPDTASILPGADVHAKVSVLLEEVGEVAHAVLEHDEPNLEEELVQVAAVCVAWLESRTEFGR